MYVVIRESKEGGRRTTTRNWSDSDGPELGDERGLDRCNRTGRKELGRTWDVSLLKYS